MGKLFFAVGTKNRYLGTYYPRHLPWTGMLERLGDWDMVAPGPGVRGGRPGV